MNKIIFITREGYNLPGARIRCYNFARELSRRGIDAEVLSFCDTLGAKDGEKEIQMRMRDKTRFNCKAFKRLVKDKQAVLCIQRFNYHSFAPYLAHLFNRNRLILDLDDWEMRENPKYYLGFYPSSKAHYFTKSLAKKSIFCIAASRFLEKFLFEFNRNVCYIPSGVDTELFKPSLNGPNTEKIVFSWIGTLHKEEYIQNIELALDCFSRIRKKYNHIYFDIVGDGIHKSFLAGIIQKFSDSNIQLHGWIPPDKIPEYLNNVHIGLFPVFKNSKFNIAKSPTKLFEYMAMAKPTVSSNIGEAAEIIQDGDNGFLAETKEEFTKKMQELIENAALRRQMGQCAREAAIKRYSLKVFGEKLYDLIRSI